MIDSTLVAQRRETVLRQAKRFSERLQLPQTTAKDVLARAFYRCAGWKDLLGRLSSRTPDRHMELLTALPRSTEAKIYFREIRRELAKSLSQHMLTNSNHAGVIDLIQAVFAVGTTPTTLADLIPTLTPSAWRSAGIGPDPWAVLETDIAINGVGLRVVATRAYMPSYYEVPEDSCSPEYAVPFEGKLRIIWTDPGSWRQAALDYLNDDEASDIELPQVELTEAMARHQRWFEASLDACWGGGAYGDHDEELIPHFVEGQGCYIIFGFVHRQVGSPENVCQDSVPLLGCDASFSQAVLLGGTPVCLEWIAYDPEKHAHPGEFDEYFAVLRRGVLASGDLHATARHDGALGILLIRPATDFDIRQALKVDFMNVDDEVAFVLKTDDVALTCELLHKAAARDLMASGSNEHRRYFAKMIAPPSCESVTLSLAIDTMGPNSQSWGNLTGEMFSTRNDQCVQLLVEVRPKLLTLLDKMGKKAVETAVKHGLILRRPAEFLEGLGQPPSRCERIPMLPDDVLKQLHEPLRGEISLSRTRYERDNF